MVEKTKRKADIQALEEHRQDHNIDFGSLLNRTTSPSPVYVQTMPKATAKKSILQTNAKRRYQKKIMPQHIAIYEVVGSYKKHPVVSVSVSR